MNDFTKEELIEICEYCNWNEYDTAHSDFRRNLRKKIHSMIDNYCEHKDVTMDCDGGISLVCAQCGHTVVDV